MATTNLSLTIEGIEFRPGRFLKISKEEYKQELTVLVPPHMDGTKYDRICEKHRDEIEAFRDEVFELNL